MNTRPEVTVVVPSLNQGRFLDRAIKSIHEQGVPVEIFIIDGGSNDGTADVILKWSSSLAGWRSFPDNGQSAAVNEGISKGSAPYVTWLNSDDYYIPGALSRLVSCLQNNSLAPMAYAKSWNEIQKSGKRSACKVEAFSESRFANKCIISQPATLIRRSVWEGVNGLNENLFMAMDYDLWWRIYKAYGTPYFLDDLVSVNSIHSETKTNKYRKLHFTESMSVVKCHYGSIPARWWLAYPYSVFFKAMINGFSLR